MGAKFTICCRRLYLRHSRGEKDAILRMRTTASTQLEALSSDSSVADGGSRASPRGPRSNEPSHGSSEVNAARDSPVGFGLDGELQAFISMRDRADKATEEWEKLNYDIHTLRYARREVRSRWRKILLQLGYQCEADALLCVNRQSRFSRDQEHQNNASELLDQLLDHTSLFPAETGHQSKYLYVMERLVSLDSAEDFVRLAKEKYPKKAG